MKFLVCLFLILVCTQASDLDYGINKFRNQPFKVRPSSGMYRIGGLHLDSITNGNQIFAYGDFNNDLASDLVSLSDDAKTLTVFKYAPDDMMFAEYYKKSFEQEVQGVMTGDFNYDGLLDMMVFTKISHNDPFLKFAVFYHQKTGPAFQEGKTVSLGSPILPTIIDANGDRLVDIIFIVDTVRYITFLADEYKTAPFTDFVSTEPGCLKYSHVEGNNFRNPHSNAFADFNGDCAADLFITSEDAEGNLIFEIWLKQEDGKFCLVDVTKITLPNVSQVSVGDMNHDGRLDLVYMESPEDLTKPMSLHVVYNQLPTDTTKPCKIATKDKISPFNKESYNMQINNFQANITQITEVKISNTSALRLFSPSASRPATIRLGDVNIDGNEDVLFIVANLTKKEKDDDDDDELKAEEEEVPKFGFPILGINHPKQGIIFDDSDPKNEFYRYFNVHVNVTDELTRALVPLQNFTALQASFFDFDEKGSLGIWLTLYNESGPSSQMGVYNFVTSSFFFLKVLGLNGNTAATKDDMNRRLGGIYHGASIECIVNDVDGVSRIARSSQIPQTAYTPLNLPYAFIGLGRTNNYVQDFSMGITQSSGKGDHQQASWTPIVPNSQLIVNPMKYDDWTLDVFVNPISQTIVVVLVTIFILVILAIIIYYLHLKEAREDLKYEERFKVFA